jgi:hypothetical protein
MDHARKTLINTTDDAIDIHIVLNTKEIEHLLDKIVELEIVGGSFSWGYDPDQSINHVVVFKKVKKVDGRNFIDDHSEIPLYKLLLDACVPFFFSFLGLYALISWVISFITKWI